jgi:hypothetical protein
MKVYIGKMTRIIVERKCGCKATQEYRDDTMQEPDGEPTYKPCPKHKRGVTGEVIQELMFEVVENKAEEHHSKSVIAIAEANAVKAAPAIPAVGEGSSFETRIPVKVGGKVVQRPPNQAAASAPMTDTGRRDTTKSRQVNLAGGSSSGMRRSTQPTSAAAVVALKTAASSGNSIAASSGNSIDAELAGTTSAVGEDPRITQHLVDAPGGLLGDPVEDPSDI